MVAITVKVSPEEARAIRAAARAGRQNVSAFIRSKVIETPARRPRRRIIKKHPASGLPYDAADEGGRTVTLEEIKAALADMEKHVRAGQVANETASGLSWRASFGSSRLKLVTRNQTTAVTGKLEEEP